MVNRVPVADELFTWPSDEPQLIASESDGVISFPPEPGAPRRLLGRRGTLWSFTTQQFRPPSPPYDGNDSAENFVPYGVGYVELPGELIVEGRLTESDPAKLKIGQTMELTVVPYTVLDDGTEVLTYAFAPVSDEETK